MKIHPRRLVNLSRDEHASSLYFLEQKRMAIFVSGKSQFLLEFFLIPRISSEFHSLSLVCSARDYYYVLYYTLFGRTLEIENS